LTIDHSQSTINVLPISVIILTYNEEKNIEACLKSLDGWVKEIFVVDSYSSDRTLDIVGNYTDNVFQHSFENYSKQRNWALKNLPIETKWVLNLDSDHRVSPELKNELQKVFLNGLDNNVNGFLISRKTIFMDKWIKRGAHYPVYHSILFRKDAGFCEDRLYDQHFVVEGELKYLKDTVIDIITDSLTNFIQRHNKWATLEAVEFLTKESISSDKKINPDMLGHAIQRRRFLRTSYNSLPLFARSFLYFTYRYFFRFGFLEGREGLIFHFLQGFWYRFLVDAKIYEIRKRAKVENRNVNDVIYELYGVEVGRGGTVEGRREKKKLEIHGDGKNRD